MWQLVGSPALNVSVFFKGLYTSGIAGGGGKARKIKRKKITWESIQALKSVRRKTNSMAAKLAKFRNPIKGTLPVTSALKNLGTAGFKDS